MKDLDYTMPLEEAEALFDESTLRALERLEDLGLGMPTRPKIDGVNYDGYLPADVNSFTNNELGDIYALQCQFSDWVSSEWIKAKADATNAKLKLETTKSHIRRTKKGTVQAREDDSNVDGRLVNAAALLHELETFAKFLEVRVGSANRGLKTISRLITTKEIEVDMNRRDLNIGRKKRDR